MFCKRTRDGGRMNREYTRIRMLFMQTQYIFYPDEEYAAEQRDSYSSSSIMSHESTQLNNSSKCSPFVFKYDRVILCGMRENAPGLPFSKWNVLRGIHFLKCVCSMQNKHRQNLQPCAYDEYFTRPNTHIGFTTYVDDVAHTIRCHPSKCSTHTLYCTISLHASTSPACPTVIMRVMCASSTQTWAECISVFFNSRTAWVFVQLCNSYSEFFYRAENCFGILIVS